MNAIQTVFEYHERTKHHPNRYAASLGYLDWSTQPDPFRIYNGSQRILLDLPTSHHSITYQSLFEQLPAQPINASSIASLLRYALGIAAWKCHGRECWALRCNASSGNLHPTEAYLLLPPMPSLNMQTASAMHYAPKDHALELLSEYPQPPVADLNENTFLLALTSITWREAWKYGERAYRYTQLDAGHALQAILISAKMLGWHVTFCENATSQYVAQLFGLDVEGRFIPEEHESVDMLLAISTQKDTKVTLFDPDPIAKNKFSGSANRLSLSHHPWEALTLVERAVKASKLPSITDQSFNVKRRCAIAADTIVLTRRSARAMDFNNSHIDKQTFLHLLHSTKTAIQVSACQLVIFVHDVEGLPQGLYLFLRNPSELTQLQQEMRQDFQFDPVDTDLYRLESGDFRPQAKFISCSQDIASDSAFSLGMLCRFSSPIEQHGASYYNALHWECGAVGQQLYLEATSLSLNATGIGCFLDDVMHRLLGLDSMQYQILYHFTIGRQIEDSRLTSKRAYEKRG